MLKCVHKCGVVIGDISKANIMVYWDGKDYIPYFIDMGIARHSKENNVIQEDIDNLHKIIKEFPTESKKQQWKLRVTIGCTKEIYFWLKFH